MFGHLRASAARAEGVGIAGQRSTAGVLGGQLGQAVEAIITVIGVSTIGITDIHPITRCIIEPPGRRLTCQFS